MVGVHETEVRSASDWNLWGETMAESTPNPGNNSADQILRIDALCDRFEDELRTGRRPLIENFRIVGGDGQIPLLRELVRLEVEYRRKQGEFPTAKEYAARYPALGASVQGLLPSATGSPRDGCASRSTSRSPQFARTLPLPLECFS